MTHESETGRVLSEEIAALEKEQEALGARCAELKARQRELARAASDRRQRLLPMRHKMDSIEHAHCVTCGKLLYTWKTEYPDHHGCRERVGTPTTHAPAINILSGYRCLPCGDALLELVLNMLEREDS